MANAPTAPEEIASFLGMVVFCSRFIPNAAIISEPLRRLTHKNTEWKWQTAFQDLKKKLKEAVTLSYYDIKKSTSLIVDASPAGLGAILIQS